MLVNFQKLVTMLLPMT